MTLQKEFGLDKVCRSLSQHNQDLIKQFIRSKQLAGIKQVSIMSEQAYLHPLIYYVGDVPLDELTTEQIEDWFLSYRDTPTKHTGKVPSCRTVLLAYNAVRQFLISTHGEDKALQMLRRIKPIRPRQTVVKEEELLTYDEICKMIAGCKTERDRAIVALLYSTGCRVGELINLKIKDVELFREYASLHLDGKTGERDIDIYSGVPELKRWMQVHPYRNDPEAPLITQKYGRGYGVGAQPMNVSGVETLLSRLARDVGIPKNKRFNPHAFRHKRATDLADYMTVADLKVIFGWSDMSNTPNIYVHSSRGKVRRKLAEIEGVKVPERVAPTTPMVRQCPVCGCLNSATDTWCYNCMSTLNEPLARAEKATEDWMLERMQ